MIDDADMTAFDTRIEMEQMDLLQLQYVLFRRKISDKKTALKI